jgi:GTPase SAR1 family protein
MLRQAVMGSGGVGKSALTVRLVTDQFTPGHEPTIEDTFRMILNVDGKTANLDILDTAGQDQFHSMQDQWIRSSQAFLLVYSIDSQASFNELKTIYEKVLRIKELRSNAPVYVASFASLSQPSIAVSHPFSPSYRLLVSLSDLSVLVGNKCDLSSARQVTEESGRALAAEWGCAFYETSAKEKINNVDCFFDVVRATREKKSEVAKKKRKCVIL